MPAHSHALASGMRLMRRYRRSALLLVPAFFTSTGCLYHARDAADETVQAMVSRPYDQLPDELREKAVTPAKQPNTGPQGSSQAIAGKNVPKNPNLQVLPTDVQTVEYMQGVQPPGAKFQLHVPEAIPGSEVAELKVPVDPLLRGEALAKIYPPLPPLEGEIKPLPGPNGKPYTLSDLQRIAAENSPALIQAAFDVQAAWGNLKQAETYQNPTMSIQETASNNNSTGGAFGFTFDQVISTGGKMKLQSAAAKKALDNAELSLKRARSDLATQVRNAYYTLLVAKETMRVTRALSVLTDEVYRVQLAYTQQAGQSAAYEPAALVAQAWSARLAYAQARSTYIYSWGLLVAAINERHLPLSEVAGRIDAFVPYYEYDKVLAHVLTHHTDTLIARNGIEVQKYNLKVNQITPYVPNLDFNIGMFKDRALLPLGTYATFGVSAPIPFWDQNRGNILAAEAALGRSLEEPHRVEMSLTSNLLTNYTNYMTNLQGVEFYRRNVLPNQIIAYRGTLQRRQIDVNAQFGDLVAAQQALATSVTTYLGLLGTLWTSVVSVADMLQTDDLFQTAEARGLPALPDLESLPPLPCCHPFGQNKAIPAVPGSTGLPQPRSVPPMLPPVTPMSSQYPAPVMPSPFPASSAAMYPSPVIPPFSAMPNSMTPVPAVDLIYPAPSMPGSINPSAMAPPIGVVPPTVPSSMVPAVPASMGPAPGMLMAAPAATVPATSPPQEAVWHQGQGSMSGVPPEGR
jgi:cobalt-zinc-cadmium efflux system outer membrane protein